MSQNMTYGEIIVKKLFEQLQKEYKDRFLFRSQYSIYINGHESKPDFVAVLAFHGVAVIEVKDWVEILEADQENFRLRGRDGIEHVLPNPFKTAQAYCYDLEKLLLERQELCKRYQGQRKLKFPWQPFVILPNISRSDIRELEKKKIIQERVFLGRESLRDAETLYKALQEARWKFTPPTQSTTKP